jgi:hypothetical protein
MVRPLVKRELRGCGRTELGAGGEMLTSPRMGAIFPQGR